MAVLAIALPISLLRGNSSTTLKTTGQPGPANTGVAPISPSRPPVPGETSQPWFVRTTKQGIRIQAWKRALRTTPGTQASVLQEYTFESWLSLLAEDQPHLTEAENLEAATVFARLREAIVEVLLCCRYSNPVRHGTSSGSCFDICDVTAKAGWTEASHCPLLPSLLLVLAVVRTSMPGWESVRRP